MYFTPNNSWVEKRSEALSMEEEARRFNVPVAVLEQATRESESCAL
jgi:hypothetical protein